MDLRWSLADSYDRAPKPARPNRPRPALVAGAMVALSTIPGSAYAEGSFSTSFSEVPQEYQYPQSRFRDNQTDKNPTTLQMSGCDVTQIYTDLRRDINNWPDESYGVHVIGNCSQSGGTSWTNVDDAGRFFFQFWWPGYAERLTAKSVNASW